ncbi:MAG: type I-D CRISPR-associated protein Cas10d/Csc3 [Oscillochloridaceae bacterium umkhey_bin13]
MREYEEEAPEELDALYDARSELEAAAGKAAKAANERPHLSREPLFALLLRDAIDASDAVLHDYAVAVAPTLARLLAHVAAKGGAFAVRKREAGVSEAEVARYSNDQSMRAHLLNGLLPTAQIARTLQRWGVPRFRDSFHDETYRLFCAGYTLHDWLKLPDVDEQLQAVGLEHHTVNVAVHLPTVEQIITTWCEQLGLDVFLAPLGGVAACLHDLIYIASNTQLQWGTMHNLAALPGLRARGRSLSLATDLATLADYLAYLGRTPVETVNHPAIRRMLATLDDGHVGVRLSYHHVADVRGVITSIINNAAISGLYVPDQREPLLYAPTGVVYLERASAPAVPPIATIAENVIARVREVCQRQLSENLTGISRGGKGIKYADYYGLFFAPQEMASLLAQFAERRIGGKEAAAGKRYANIVAKQMAPRSTDLALPSTVEVDRIAEICAILVRVAAEAAPNLDAEGLLLEQMGIAEARPLVQQINSNRTAGGVPYGWYYAAGLYCRNHPTLDEQQWIERMHALTHTLAQHLPADPPTDAEGWSELRRYVTDHLRFEQSAPTEIAARIQGELRRYHGARKSGHGSTTVCALCSSPYTISPQQEAATLFAPMVYTNKQPLHGSKAIRHICAICGFEMMLRQLLMKRGRESGGDFEKRKLRYLFFYPTYFFTPESLKMLRMLHDRLKRVSFTSLRTLLQPPDDDPDAPIDLSPELFQRLEALMLEPRAPATADDDRLFRLRFPPNEPITFSFIGLPPSERDAKDAEAWINPAFLALVLPLVLDVKVVASESLLPLVQEATELPETVFFDSPHAFVGRIVGQPRLNLDQLLPALQRLTASYLIHLDGNAKSGAGGFDYRWHEIPALARNLETSPLYAFHYLKKGLRRENSDHIPAPKAVRYVDLVDHYLAEGSEAMSHARTLVLHYRRFYRHKRGRLNSNSIVRPISEASKALLSADLRLFPDVESLLEVVKSRIEQFVERVGKDKADGTVPVWLYPKDQVQAEIQAAIDDFSRYFVETIYRDVFKEDRAALAGKQLNLLKNACESIYLAEQRREWRERNEHPEESQDDE